MAVNLEKQEKDINKKLSEDSYLQECSRVLSEYLEPCALGDYVRFAVLKSIMYNKPVYLDLPKILRSRVRILYNIFKE